MMKALEMIGEINEAELMEISEGNEMVAGASTWACATVTITVQITIYTIQDSANSCPTTACSSRC